MSFSDEDLERVKEAISLLEAGSPTPLSFHDVKALLSRLKAAEDLHVYADHKSSCGLSKSLNVYCDCNLPVFQNRWRKVSGK